MNPIRTRQLNANTPTFISLMLCGLIHATGAQAANLANAPLFVKASQPPLVMLTMARDHKLYYEAYNDYSDLNGDGSLDVGYKPGIIEYYGQFDSYKCYSYSGGIFTPAAMSDALGTTPETYNKKCTGSGRDNYWSGDFLNYVTTSRIDALRKVLYGGYRSTDTTTQTILERAFIPQDAHTWGKEYHSIANDGYDISEYTPLAEPMTGKRHLFANVTLTGYGQPPLMRVLDNSSFRIWNWVSIERPVAGTQCATGNNSRSNCATAAGSYTGNPADAAAFQTLIDTYATTGHRTGFRNVDQINAAGSNLNPYATDPDEYYLDVFRGTLKITTAGDYQFSVDGDDAVELWIDGNLVVGWYGGHGLANNDDHKATVNLTAGTHAIEFRHQEAGGGEGWRLRWNGPDSGNGWAIVPKASFSNLVQTFYDTVTPASTMTDYTVRNEVCKEITGIPATAYYGREANCKAYTDGTTTTYKPTGLLHKYGDNNGMYFGLLTGSYDQNTNGGILRKAMSSITNEIETSTGIFKESGSTCGTASSSPCVAGIVGTINRLHITSFDYGSYAYSCGWITTRAMNPGECEMWGNPLAEMIYEAARYFSGATSATAAFTTNSTRDNGVTLPGGGTGLPRFTTWTNPYTASQTVPIPDTGPFPYCSKPFLMLISDVYPSFDSDSIPGVNSNFGNLAASQINNATLDVSAKGQELWNLEFGTMASKNIFIGQVGATYDGAPTAKTASSFGNIRGLAPSDPTRQGSYYSASVANFGLLNDLNPVIGNQKLGTYSIALAAPLPTIQVPIPGSPDKPVTIVPFAKSVGGSGISATQGAFQPTNQIVDFYVDIIKNTTVGNMDANVNGGRPYYLFRINFEDVEQGADHDMDAIALYEVKLNADNTVSVKVDSIYAAGGIIQHMGYVISGTTADGIYLVVRDTDTGYGSDPEYFLDRPNSSDTGIVSTYHLPVRSIADPDVPDASNFATRTFTPNTTSGTSASILNDPLWYAAKFGGFNDINGDGVPQTNEWDADNDKVPDNYFLVVNPLRLLRQLDDALGKIKDTSGTAAATTANSFTLQTDTQIFLGRFNSDGWSGELIAYPVTATSIGNADWQAQIEMTKKSPSSRVILTYDPDKASGSRGITFEWSSMTSAGVLQDSLNRLSTGTVDGLGDKRVDFLRGVDVVGMRTRPQILLTNISSSSCVGSYSCPSGGGVAYCSTSGSVTCTPTGKTNLLGDIINSQSQYIGRPNGGFSDASYAKFVADYSGTNPTGKGDRKAMIYVGANDGMLHGFDAKTGEELLAYVPSDTYRLRNSRWGLSKLTEPDYGKTGSTNAHRYYVDATPTIGDICTDENVGSCGNGNWRSLLVGALGAGGQGIFALDVTDPSTFSNANAATLVKWEFSDKDDPDLGYTIGRPYIVRLCTTRLPDGSCDKWTWHVLINSGFNNTEADGYVSSTGDAALFVLNANTGALVKKINVKQGDTTATGPNALAEIAPVDLDGDGIVDYVYAGDIKGNMWRFDFTNQNPSAWDITLGSSTNPAPLYVAWDEQSTRARQPITTAPDAIRHPNGGVLLNFGTGSYIFKTDDLTTQTQTVYGIWDKVNASSVASTNRLNLQQQQVITATVQGTSTFAFGGVTKTETTDYRTVTDNSIDWGTKDGWYFNLPDTGERISNNVEIRGGSVLRVVSTVPSDDICAAGGYSWEYFVDAFNGGRLQWSAYTDLSGLQNFGGTSAFASARKSTTGITPPGVIITNPKGDDVEFDFGSAGQTIVKKNLGKGKAGRLGWREILTD